MLPAVLLGLAVLVPLGYLFSHIFTGDWQVAWQTLWRIRTLTTLWNTLALTVAVVGLTLVLALPAAWLVTRTDLWGRRLIAVLLVLPLAVPGYLLAFTLLSVGGGYGASARWLGIELPRLSGFWGAVVALGIYNFPYLFLPLRAGFQRIDPTLEQAARTLGRGALGAWWTAVLPQLRPAMAAGGLLVALHVIGDFGVVSLMRYDTFSYVLFSSLVFEPNYAAWLALMMLGLSGLFLGFELWLLRGQRFDRAGSGPGQLSRRVRLGVWQVPVLLLIGLFLALGVGVPLLTSCFWALQPKLEHVAQDLMASGWASVKVSLPTAFASALLATPIAFMAARYPGRRSRGLERLAYAGYATPGLAFGLALVWLSLWLDRWLAPEGSFWLYQSLFVMIYAYTLNFMAEAVGPIRASLQQAGCRLEEASRALGYGVIATFFRVTLPLIRGGMVASIALVFLSAMKELPLAIMLRPSGFDTLAFNLWDLTNEALYAEAAPYALAILAVSFAFVLMLLLRLRRSGGSA